MFSSGCLPIQLKTGVWCFYLQHKPNPSLCSLFPFLFNTIVYIAIMYYTSKLNLLWAHHRLLIYCVYDLWLCKPKQIFWMKINQHTEYYVWGLNGVFWRFVCSPPAAAFWRGDKPWKDPIRTPQIFDVEHLIHLWQVWCTLGPYIATHSIMSFSMM